MSDDEALTRQSWSEHRWNATPDHLIVNGELMQFTKPPLLSIVIMAEDGAELLRLSWPDGRLHADGDESRWTEAAARFVAEMRRIVDAV